MMISGVLAMRLTNTYTRVAVSSKEVPQEFEEDELGTEDLDSHRSAKKGKAVNPWAVCHESTGPEKGEKFERCVQDVKKKHKIKHD
jgi:hypothetical protein